MNRIKKEQRQRWLQRAMVAVSAAAAVALVVIAMMIFLPNDAPAPQFAANPIDSTIAPTNANANAENIVELAANELPTATPAPHNSATKSRTKAATRTAPTHDLATEIPAEILNHTDEYFCDLDCEMVQYYHEEFLVDEYYELE